MRKSHENQNQVKRKFYPRRGIRSRPKNASKEKKEEKEAS